MDILEAMFGLGKEERVWVREGKEGEGGGEGEGAPLATEELSEQVFEKLVGGLLLKVCEQDSDKRVREMLRKSSPPPSPPLASLSGRDQVDTQTNLEQSHSVRKCKILEAISGIAVLH